MSCRALSVGDVSSGSESSDVEDLMSGSKRDIGRKGDCCGECSKDEVEEEDQRCSCAPETRGCEWSDEPKSCSSCAVSVGSGGEERALAATRRAAIPSGSCRSFASSGREFALRGRSMTVLAGGGGGGGKGRLSESKVGSLTCFPFAALLELASRSPEHVGQCLMKPVTRSAKRRKRVSW